MGAVSSSVAGKRSGALWGREFDEFGKILSIEEKPMPQVELCSSGSLFF
jgi:hypothetical protein